VAGLSLNARAITTSHQYADAANSQQVPSWTRVDLGASYATRVMDRDVSLRARVDNAFDRNYWASAGGYPGYGYLVLGAPRTLTLSATVDF
jgi:iron complex outermembrane receptor protein